MQQQRRQQLSVATNDECRTTRPRVQGHNIFTLRRTMAMTASITATKSTKLTTKPRTPCCETAMMSTIMATKSTKWTTKPCASRCQTGNDDKALCACTRHAGRIARWQRQQGLVHKHTACWSTIWPCVQAHDMPVVSHDGNDYKASCASAQHASCVARRATTTRPCAQAHNILTKAIIGSTKFTMFPRGP